MMLRWITIALVLLCLPAMAGDEFTNSITKRIANNESGIIMRNSDGTASFLAPTQTNVTVYSGTTLQPSIKNIMKTATTGALGQTVIYLTADNTSTGTALCPTGIWAAEFSYSGGAAATTVYKETYTLTNSNRTMTVTTNSLALSLGALIWTLVGSGLTTNANIWCN